ncbi:MAG: choice-of-anchor B family protein [Flavobacteriales bacterium]
MKLVACGLWLVAGGSANAQDSLNVRQLGRWSDATLPASSLYDNTYNAVWGYTRDGREYGIIGSTMGTHIIDVTDAHAPVQVAFVAGAVQGGDVVHREFKTYHDLLYAVTDEGPGTLQIIDLRYLPDSVAKVYDSNALFYRAHTLWIDTLNARLYTHGGSSDFAIWSLADPTSPTLLLKPSMSVPWWNNVGYVHDAYTIDNVTYTNDVDAMHIIDFTNVAAPVLRGSLTQYPQAGYNHSGWLHDNGRLYVMADETHGTDLKLFDVSDRTDIQFIDTVGLDRGPGSIPHNPVFQGDLLHASWYYDGYVLWSVADPAHAQLLGYYDTHPEPYTFSYKGAWGVYPFLPSGHVLVSDMQRGLYVLDISDALSTGIAERSVTGGTILRTWPNPATDRTNIRLPAGLHGPITVEVRDPSGRLEQRSTQRAVGTDLSLDISAWAEGMHVVRLSDGRNNWMTRVMKIFAR